MSDEIVFNPCADRPLVRREIKTADVASIAEAVKAHFQVSRTPYEQVADPPPPSFPNYHFVRELDSVTIPVINFKKAYQHDDNAGLIRGLTRCTLPWAEPNVATEMFASIKYELDSVKGAHDSGLLWHYVIFHFEEDVVVYACRAPLKAKDGTNNPIKDLETGVAEGRFFRFRHEPENEHTPSHVFAFTLIAKEEQHGGEMVTVTVAHRVL
jgi:hypothetical protein